MTSRQKIEIRRSQIRGRLGEISAMETNAVTDEIAKERDALFGELRATEPQLQAAIAAEATEARHRGDQRHGDGETAERRSLIERSRLAGFVREAHSQGALQGAEAELRHAVFGDAGGRLVPHEMLLPRGAAPERRADVATNVAANAAAQQDSVLGRLFADSLTSYLGVSLVPVDRGVSAHPVLSDGVGATMAGKGTAVDADAATVGVTTLEPRRLSARYVFRAEDLARVDALEEALRRDLARAMSHRMDALVVSGDGMGADPTGFMAAIAAPDVPATVGVFGNLLGMATDAVDGIGATNIQQVRIATGVDLYQFAGRLFTSNGDLIASDYLLERAGGLRATPFIANAPTTGARAHVAESLAYRTGAPGSAVAAIWRGFEMTIRDEITGAASGEIALTAVSLWNFALLRASAYTRFSVKVAE